MSDKTKITSKDLEKIILEETTAFLRENRDVIIKRAQKRLRASTK